MVPLSRSGRLVESRISNTSESVSRMPSLGNAISCAISNINIQRSEGWRGGGVVRAFLLKIQSVPREINMAMLQLTATSVLIIKSVATCYDAHTRVYISTRSIKITRLIELLAIMDTCRFVSSFFHSGANLLPLEKNVTFVIWKLRLVMVNSSSIVDLCEFLGNAICFIW